MSEFNKFADLMIEAAYQENIKNLGKPMAELMKRSVIQLKPVIEIFFNKGMEIGKAQAVPEHTNQTFEDWLSDPENTKVYLGGYRERANEFAHQAWIASLKAKLPKDKILMPRSLDQKHIDYVVHQLAISSGASLISEVYECLIEAQEPAND